MARTKCNVKLSRVFLLLIFNFGYNSKADGSAENVKDAKNEPKYDYSALYEKPYSTPIVATFQVTQTFDDEQHFTHCTTETSSIDIFLTSRARRTFPSFFTKNNSLYVNPKKASHFSSDFLVIGFEQSEKIHKNRSLNYMATVYGDEIHKISIESLKPNRFYRFCCIEQGIHTVIPMDCVAIYIKHISKEQSAWILKEDQNNSILIVAFYGLVGVIFGFLLSIRLAKCYPTLFLGKS